MGKQISLNVVEAGVIFNILFQKAVTCFKPGPVYIDLSSQQNPVRQISFAYKTEDLNSTLLLYQVYFYCLLLCYLWLVILNLTTVFPFFAHKISIFFVFRNDFYRTLAYFAGRYCFHKSVHL